MGKHKFQVGQTVQYLPQAAGPAARGSFKVTRQLPGEGEDREYRIKSANEPHERVVKESSLVRSTLR